MTLAALVTVVQCHALHTRTELAAGITKMQILHSCLPSKKPCFKDWWSGSFLPVLTMAKKRIYLQRWCQFTPSVSLWNRFLICAVLLDPWVFTMQVKVLENRQDPRRQCQSGVGQGYENKDFAREATFSLPCSDGVDKYWNRHYVLFKNNKHWCTLSVSF